jgi:hypothetical protein
VQAAVPAVRRVIAFNVTTPVAGVMVAAEAI